MKRSIAATCLLAGLLAFVPGLAGSPQEANELYQARDWPAAEEAYRALVEQAPDNTLFKYRLAVILRNQGKLQAAETWLEQARGGLVPDAYVDLERARLLLAKGESGAAISALEASAAQGFSNKSMIEDDPAFATLAGDAGFAEVLERVDRNSAPCRYIPEFSHFDFWLGQWRVLGLDGSFQGSNRIEKTQGDCLVLENWTGAMGGTGTSMNFFDPHAKEWVQVWVSPLVQLEIRGGLVDGSMVLNGHIYYVQDGSRRPFRGTWTPQDGGVVRQHFEESTDGGATWSTWFDGYYHPIEAGGEESG